MVSEKFINNLEKLIGKRLKRVVTRSPTFKTFGSADDQPKGPGDDLATKFIPLSKSEYSAREYLMATIPVNDPNLSAFHLATPILNVKKTSVQGVATFMAVVPYPVPETFIERMAIRQSHRLLPHDLVARGITYKDILDQNMIHYPAVLNINRDKKLCKALAGSLQCDVEVGGLSSSVYKVKLDYEDLVSGVFTIVPYQGSTLLISKEAGQFGAKADSPRYDLAARFAALSGVASHITAHPQANHEVGAIYADASIELLLSQVRIPDPSTITGGSAAGVAAMARGDLDWTDKAPPEAAPPADPSPYPSPFASPPPPEPIPPQASEAQLPQPMPQQQPTAQPMPQPAPQPMPQPVPQTMPTPPPTAMPAPQPTPPDIPEISEEGFMLVHCPGCGTGLEVEPEQDAFVCPLCHNAYARQD